MPSMNSVRHMKCIKNMDEIALSHSEDSMFFGPPLSGCIVFFNIQLVCA